MIKKHDLKNLFIKKHLSALMDQPVLQVGLKGVCTLAILTDLEQDAALEMVKNALKIFKLDPSKCKVLLLDPVLDNSYTEDLPNCIYLQKQDIKWGGGLKHNTDAADFANTSYDVLINFCSEKNLRFNYIAALSKAKFKIGLCHSTISTKNNLCINIGFNQPDIFLSEIKKYLKILNLL